MGSLLISVKDFNGVKDYFGVLQYQDYIETLPVFLKIELWGQGKFILLCQQRFWMEISTGPLRYFDHANTGPYTILYGKINRAKANITIGHCSFYGPVFP